LACVRAETRTGSKTRHRLRSMAGRWTPNVLGGSGHQSSVSNTRAARKREAQKTSLLVDRADRFLVERDRPRRCRRPLPPGSESQHPRRGQGREPTCDLGVPARRRGSTAGMEHHKEVTSPNGLAAKADHAATASAEATRTSKRGQGSRNGAAARSTKRRPCLDTATAASRASRATQRTVRGNERTRAAAPAEARTRTKNLAGTEDRYETSSANVTWVLRRPRHGTGATTCRPRERRRKRHRPRAAASAAARSRRAEPAEVARPAQRARPPQRRCFGTTSAAVDLRGVAQGSDGECWLALCSRSGGGTRPTGRSRRGPRTDAQRKAESGRGASAPRTPQATQSVLPEGPVGTGSNPRPPLRRRREEALGKPPASVY
jgi:hypothetical protein